MSKMAIMTYGPLIMIIFLQKITDLHMISVKNFILILP